MESITKNITKNNMEIIDNLQEQIKNGLDKGKFTKNSKEYQELRELLGFQTRKMVSEDPILTGIIKGFQNVKVGQ